MVFGGAFGSEMLTLSPHDFLAPGPPGTCKELQILYNNEVLQRLRCALCTLLRWAPRTSGRPRPSTDSAPSYGHSKFNWYITTDTPRRQRDWTDLLNTTLLSGAENSILEHQGGKYGIAKA